MRPNALPCFSLFAPPYRDFLPIDPADGFASGPETLRGLSLVWKLGEGHGSSELKFAAERPGGVALVVILPSYTVLRRLKATVLEVVEDARPRSILPYHPRPEPEEMAHLLRRPPEALPGELLDFLMWRGLYLDRETRRIVHRIVELAGEVTTLSALARNVYVSRRALGRRFSDRELPVPSHWLQFCRILRASIKLQNTQASLHDVARSFGYPDGFTLSNQMDRILGVRPSIIRERLGWEWVTETWLRREWMSGGLGVPLHGMPRRERPSVDTHAASPQGSVPRAIEGATPRAKAGEAERSGAAAWGH